MLSLYSLAIPRVILRSDSLRIPLGIALLFESPSFFALYSLPISRVILRSDSLRIPLGIALQVLAPTSSSRVVLEHLSDVVVVSRRLFQGRPAVPIVRIRRDGRRRHARSLR